MDTLAKEMYDVGIAFEDGRTPGVGCKNELHQEGLVCLRQTYNSRPYGSTFAGVVSHESVQIAFIYTALNGLDVCTADIQNAIYRLHCHSKIILFCGPEFGLENIGSIALIHRALYSGKLAGKDFRLSFSIPTIHLLVISERAKLILLRDVFETE